MKKKLQELEEKINKLEILGDLKLIRGFLVDLKQNTRIRDIGRFKKK